jgi:hypothetical protein
MLISSDVNYIRWLFRCVLLMSIGQLQHVFFGS